MASTLTIFPVGNGDMSLIKLGDDFTLLIDCNLKDATTDNCPVLMVDDLFEMLPRDESKRPYVDVFMITHPDQDHCQGAEKYLHFGKPDAYVDKPKDGERKKIFVRELWSSPLTFRRFKKKRKKNENCETLCSDGKAIWAEARRRVAAYKEANKAGKANSNKD
ncbi:MAG: metallohydrolase, partial [Arenibacter algicola]|nr:metallohydrolase [Arenibacter algicola]